MPTTNSVSKTMPLLTREEIEEQIYQRHKKAEEELNRPFNEVIDEEIRDAGNLASSAVRIVLNPLGPIGRLAARGASKVISKATSKVAETVQETLKEHPLFSIGPEPPHKIRYPDEDPSTDSEMPASVSLLTPLTPEECCNKITVVLTEMGVPLEDIRLLFSSEMEKIIPSLSKIEKNLSEAQAWMKSQSEILVNQQQIADLNRTFDFIEQLGAMVGSQEIKVAGTFGRGLLTIADSVANLERASNLGSLTFHNVLGFISSLGGVALTLISLFMNDGVSPSVLILNKLDKLSEKLDEHHQATMKSCKQITELQIETMRMISSGFRLLYTSINLNIWEVGSKLLSGLSSLQSSLDLLSEIVVRQGESHLLLQLSDLLAKVDLTVEAASFNSSKKIPKLIEDLLIWATVHAKNGQLTGELFFNAWTRSASSAQFNKLIQLTTGSQLASHINLLKGLWEAGQTAPLINSTIWFFSLNRFVTLRLHQPDMAVDASHYAAEKMIEEGEQLQKFINAVAKDKSGWKRLFKAHKAAIDEVEKYIKDFFADESSRCFSKLETQRKEKDNPQGAVSAISLFSNSQAIDAFIETFDGRYVLHIPGPIRQSCNNEITVAGTKFEVPPIDLDIKNHFYQKELHQKISIEPYPGIYEGVFQENMPPSLLAAEYLGKCSFKATCEKSISGPVSTNEMIEINGDLLVWPADCRKNGDVAIFKQWCLHTTYTDEIWQIKPRRWNLPVELIAVEMGLPIKTLIFFTHLDYNIEMAAAVKCTGSKTMNNKQVLHVHKFQDDQSKKDVAAKLAGYISGNINRNREAAHYEGVAFYAAAAAQLNNKGTLSSHYKGEVRKFFIDERQSAVKRLTSNPAFLDLLETLNMRANLIKAFLLLTGKKTENTVFDRPLSGTAVQKALKEYAINPAADAVAFLNIDPLALWEKPQLTFDEVDQLEELSAGQLGPLHPKRAVDAGIASLKIYQTWSQLYLSKYPELRRFQSVEEYNIQEAVLAQRIFQTETYAHFERLHSAPLREAKHQIQVASRYFEEPPVKVYAKAYFATTWWACEESCGDLAVGAAIPQLRGRTTLNQAETRQALEHGIKGGWDLNLRTLQQQVLSVDHCKYRGGWRPASLKMWADGTLGLLQLVYHDGFKKAAAELGNHALQRLETLKDLYQVGNNLQALIFSLCLSEGGFSSIFNTYRSAIDGVCKMVESAHRKLPKNDKTSAEKKDAALLAESGARMLWKRLDGVSKLLHIYLELLFNRQIEIGQMNPAYIKIYDSKELIPLLQEKRAEHESILTILGRYIARLDKVQGDVAMIQKRGKELLFLWNYLQTLPPSLELVLDAKRFGPSLFPQKAELIRDFLQNHFVTSSIVFHGISFPDENEGANSWAVEFFEGLARHVPKVKRISILDAEVGEKTLEKINGTHRVHFAAGEKREVAQVDFETGLFLQALFEEGPQATRSSYLRLNMPFSPPILSHLLHLLTKARFLHQEAIAKGNIDVGSEYDGKAQSSILRGEALRNAARRKMEMDEPLFEKLENDPAPPETGELIDVSGFGNSCGLFALLLAIKMGCELTEKRPNENFPPALFEVKNSMLTNKQPTGVKALHEILRDQLIMSYRSNTIYQAMRKEGFLHCCIKFIQGAHLPADMEAFTLANGEFLEQVKKGYEQHFVPLTEELLTRNAEKIGAFSVEITDIVKFRSRYQKSVQETDVKDLPQLAKTLLDSLYPSENEAMSRAIKQKMLLAAAVKKIDMRTNKPSRKLLSLLESLIDERLLEAAEVNSDSYSLIALARLTSVNSKGKVKGHSPLPIVQEELISLYAKKELQSQWNEIYNKYCSYVQKKKPMLSADELGCLAEYWGLQLEIKFANGVAWSTSSKNQDSMRVVLCNPSLFHWQVYLEPNL